MAWDFETEPEFEEQLEWMRAFTQRGDLPDRDPRALLRRRARRSSRRSRTRCGGAGCGPRTCRPSSAAWGSARCASGSCTRSSASPRYGPLVFGNNAPDSGNAELLAVGMELTGRTDIRERWLEPLLAGTMRSGFSMTEPHTAGSDPKLLKTRAVRDGDEWVINGRKWYTSNGSVADILIVMAVTNPDVHPYQGSSMFVVPVDAPGRHDRARRRVDGRPARRLRALRQPRRDHLRGRARARPTTSSARRARGSCSPRRASARAASTTACAGSASRSARST